MSGKIAKIFISPNTDTQMQSVNEIVLEEGKGIFGNNQNISSNEITLIEQEKVDAFNKENNCTFEYSDFNRNIVISNCDLDSLINKEFQIGNVVLKGTSLCEPCGKLTKDLDENTIENLKQKAGLNAIVLRSGNINLSSQLEK